MSTALIEPGTSGSVTRRPFAPPMFAEATFTPLLAPIWRISAGSLSSTRRAAAGSSGLMTTPPPTVRIPEPRTNTARSPKVGRMSFSRSRPVACLICSEYVCKRPAPIPPPSWFTVFLIDVPRPETPSASHESPGSSGSSSLGLASAAFVAAATASRVIRVAVAASESVIGWSADPMSPWRLAAPPGS